MKTLVNVGRRRCVITLDHPEFHRRVWGFARQLVCTHELNPRNGAVGRLERHRPAKGSLTLLGGEARENFPDAIAAVPDVVRLQRAGQLKVLDVEDTVVASPAPPPMVKNGVAKPKNGDKPRKVEE